MVIFAAHRSAVPSPNLVRRTTHHGGSSWGPQLSPVSAKGVFLADRLSMHDPCNLARKSGVIAEQRNLMEMVADNFVELNEHGKYQWCCGAGGGVSSNERAEGLKMTAFKRKKAQIEEVEPKRMVTMCATCRTQLEEGLEEFNMDIPVVGLTEIIAEHLVEKETRQ